ncbi:MAG: thioredoxin family protein [Planctomycetota bacterium]|nr:thioredoxin family protein [Planctomycetota bacterium]
MQSPASTRRSSDSWRWFLCVAALFASVSQSVSAQGLNVFDSKRSGGLAIGGGTSRGLQIDTSLTTDRLKAGAVATLTVKATIPQGFHLYSMAEGYAGRTRIELTETPGLTPVGEFQADHAPKVKLDETLGIELEEFTGSVAWTRQMRIVDPAIAKVAGKFIGTYCSSGEGGQCLRTNESFITSITKVDAPPTEAGAATAAFSSVESPLVGKNPGPATLRFSLAPENAQPGDTVTLNATMTLDDGWHTYAVTQPKVPGARPTTFSLDKAKGLTPIGDMFVADRAPKRSTLETSDGDSPIEEHGGSITWSRQFRVDDAAYGVEGSINYVTCREALCNQPKTIVFAFGDLDGAGPVPAALPAPTSLSDTFTADDAGEANLPLYLGLAFLGGLILNVMPCVLPVVAIKVMSFVQHAGDHRGRIFTLNASYAVGVIVVFLCFAALAALPQWFGWLFQALDLSTTDFSFGKLFQSDRFNLAMAGVVFAMSLSLLGVFEIPIPGMIGSAAGSASHEGLSGAFLTGVFATLLATPCLGPFVGPVLFWSMKQSLAVTFLTWATMGLGMASPYLVFGLVPGAVKLLPKPGAWMVQFKQFGGFLLLATALWLLTSVRTDLLMPMLVALLGIALALWMVGMVQFSLSPMKRRAVSAAAVALGAGIAAFGYTLSVEPTHKLAWEPFSTARLNALRADNKPILVDFTADYCFNCKTNERLALNTEETKAIVERHGVVPLVADFSDGSSEIKQWLDSFGVVGVPLTVIFPADRPNEPIILEGVYSQTTLLKKLEEAVKPPAVAQAAVKTANVR